LKALALEISMKHALLTLVVLIASLAYSQAKDIPKAPAPPATTAPAATPLGVSQAGGLDDRCQSGLNGHYNFDGGTFGTNNPAESQTLSDASACIGYVTGWSQTIDTAFISMENKLWFIEISESFSVTTEADGLHEYLKANPEARVAPTSLVLLDVAVGKGMATVSPVDIKGAPDSQPQHQEQNPAPPVLKSKA
jgi:hypothetical protein